MDQPTVEPGTADGAFAFVHRAVLAYVPLHVVASSGALDPVLGPGAVWLGRWLFNTSVAVETTVGSDRVFDYLMVFATLVLAIGVATGWTLVSKRRSVSPNTADVIRTLARLFVGYVMLGYGWSKVFPVQFPSPGPDRWLMSFGDATAMGLAWTFMGASVGYQVFAGVIELIGAYLILWRRTALAGALVTAGALANVVAINLFHDVPVKIFSGHLLLFCLFIIAPDAQRLVGFLFGKAPVATRVDRPFWRNWGRWTAAILVLHVGFMAWQTYGEADRGYEFATARGVFSDPHPLAGIYAVESFQQSGLSGNDLEDTARWVRVALNPPNRATVRSASGHSETMRLILDDSTRTASLVPLGAQPPSDPAFVVLGSSPDSLRLEGTFRGTPTEVLMVREQEPMVFASRRFRWARDEPTR